MSSALELAKSFGLEEVRLPDPPGFEARIRLPSMSELMRKGEMPIELRRSLLSMKGQEQTSEPSDEQVDTGVDFTAVKAARMVRAVRIGDAEWEPVHLGVDDFLALPEKTQDALLEIVTGQRTPAMVTAIIRRKAGEISDEEAAAIVEAETPKLVKEWATFRDDGGSPESGGDSQGVEPTPIKPARSKRSGAGLRTG